ERERERKRERGGWGCLAGFKYQVPLFTASNLFRDPKIQIRATRKTNRKSFFFSPLPQNIPNSSFAASALAMAFFLRKCVPKESCLSLCLHLDTIGDSNPPNTHTDTHTHTHISRPTDTHTHTLA